MAKEPVSIFDGDRDEDEVTYREMIDAACLRKDSTVISNGKPRHAVYLIYKFFTEALSSVKICCQHLSRHKGGILAYADPKIAEAAVDFLHRCGNGKLSIIIVDRLDIDEPQKPLDHPLIKAIDEAGLLHKVDLRQLVKDGDGADGVVLPYDFLVVDEEILRVEVDPVAAKAFVNFGDRDFARTMSDVFDGMRDLYTRSLLTPATTQG